MSDIQTTEIMKKKVFDLLDGKNSKSFHRLLKSKPDLLEYLAECQSQFGAENTSETLWCLYNNQLPPKCSCGNKKLFNTFVKGHRDTCSPQCRYEAHSQKLKVSWDNKDQTMVEKIFEKVRKTNIEKYGFEHESEADSVKDKMKKTNLERYGAKSPVESAVIQEKIKKTLMANHGVEFPFQSAELREKASRAFVENNPDLPDRMYIARQAFHEQYGMNPFAVPELKQKVFDTKLLRYGYRHTLQHHLPLETVAILENQAAFKKELAGLTLAESAEKLNVSWGTIVRRAEAYECRNIFSTSTRSVWEFKLKNFLLSIGLIEYDDFVTSDRKILGGKELDFYFPKINAAIEVGSIFWHSELNGKRTELYHYDKWKMCAEKGITLYQYWDSELLSSWPVVESKIRYLFNKIDNVVGAREVTHIGALTVEDERQFLETNHIQGFSGDRSYVFGAYIDDKLVGIMCFARRPDHVELTRFASDISTNYPGLFSKLLNYAIKTADFKNTPIHSFSDNRHSNGNVYAKSGFTMTKKVNPTYYYTKDYHNFERKRNFTKLKIQEKFGVDITGKTEWQLMQELGYDRIWDAGKHLWIKQS